MAVRCGRFDETASSFKFVWVLIACIWDELKQESEISQEMTQSQTADKPMAQQGRDTEHRQP